MILLQSIGIFPLTSLRQDFTRVVQGGKQVLGVFLCIQLWHLKNTTEVLWV